MWLRVLLPAFLAATGCGAGFDGEAAVRDDAALLGHLQSRDRVLTFHAGAGAGGPRFSVRSRDGRALATDLSLDELAARHPDLVRVYEQSFAVLLAN